MVPLPGVISDTFEELGETAKQTGQQLAKLPKDLFETGSQQVQGQQQGSGDDLAAGDSGMETILGGGGTGSQQQRLKQQLTPQQQVELKKAQDGQRSMVRYQQILEEIKRYRQQKAQETPAYIAGKAGAPKTKEEEIELWQKQQKEAEEKKKQEAIRLPGQQGGTQGSAERQKFVAG